MRRSVSRLAVFTVLTAVLLLVSTAALAWTCSSCGTYNSGNFCTNCGRANSSSWTCVCGTKNTGNYCSQCGRSRTSGSSGSSGSSFSGIRTTLSMRLATRSGPSTSYCEPGSFLQEGASMVVYSRYLDGDVWWLQTEVSAGGYRARVYSGKKRFNISDYDFNRLPVETVQRRTTLRYDTTFVMGPGGDYAPLTTGGLVYGSKYKCYAGTSVNVISTENGYAQVDFSQNGQLHRGWVPVSYLN